MLRTIKKPAARSMPVRNVADRGEHLNAMFNLGFRRGANDRAQAGLPFPPPPQKDIPLPPPPTDLVDAYEKEYWRKGYKQGYATGTADVERDRISG